MSHPFRTLLDHNHSTHRALHTLFRQCLKVVQDASLPRATVVAGISDAITALRAHHLYEDELLVPTVQAAELPGPWDRVGEEHQEMAALLEVLEEREHGPEDLSDLVQPISQIVELLGPHFAAEEAALTEDAWRQVFATEDEASAFGKQVAAHNRAGNQPAARLLPLLLYNLDEVERARFTDRMPGFLVNGLVPYAFRSSWRHLRPFMAHPPARITPSLRRWRG